MDKLRLLFSKTDRAVYISHLDLMRTLTRAFLRAECRLKYSEGFNPHPQISIALPLSVGAESICEIMDFKLIEDKEPDEILAALSKQLPEGIEAISVYASERKIKELKWLKITGIFEYDERNAGNMAEKLNEFYAKDSIVISKKTKRGIGESDIKQAIKEIAFTDDGDNVRLDAIVSAQGPTLNPELLAEALRQLNPEIAPDYAKFRRLEVYDENMRIFR